MKRLLKHLQISFWIVFGVLLYTSAYGAEMCIEITEEDEALKSYTDAYGWTEDKGTRKAYAKDILLKGIVETIATQRSGARINSEIEKINLEEKQKAAMELAPKVRVITDEEAPSE